MVVIVTGASHVGKTLLAQRLLEKHHWPYLSVDHLKMGLIRSGMTDLTPEDDDQLTGLLWPVVREMVKTAVENEQNLIVEGCYVPFHWRRDFSEACLRHIRFLCLAMSSDYIDAHIDEIMGHACEIEARLDDSGCTADRLKADNRRTAEGFEKAGERVIYIRGDYEKTVAALLEESPEESEGPARGG